MKALIQRVSSARVEIDLSITGEIEHGFLILLGVEEEDSKEDLDYIVKKIIGLRVFSDSADKMNLSIQQVNGSLLIVSQFTLLADTRKGNRPSFNKAANPSKGLEYYELAVEKFKQSGIPVKTGIFGAKMDVSLVNNGPVTILLDSKDRQRPRN